MSRNSEKQTSAHHGDLPASVIPPAEAHTSDSCQSDFAAEAAQQSALVAQSSYASEDQAFVDAVSEIDPSKSEATP